MPNDDEMLKKLVEEVRDGNKSEELKDEERLGKLIEEMVDKIKSSEEEERVIFSKSVQKLADSLSDLNELKTSIKTLTEEFVKTRDSSLDTEIIEAINKLDKETPEFPKEIKISNEVAVSNLDEIKIPEVKVPPFPEVIKAVLVDSEGRPIDLAKLYKPQREILGARGGSGPTEVSNETPSGSVNDVNTVFTLTFSPIAETVKVYVNGARQLSGSGNDFTLSGSTITFTNPPSTGSNILVDYKRV